MSNKFLGLDSINVLTSYIDQAVSKKTENSLVLTVQAYKYYEFNTEIEFPVGGGFDFNHGAVIWPDGGWNSLDNILKGITDLEAALSEGAIYVSSAVVTGKDSISWSRPIRVSGQNGVSVKFKYAYDVNATTWTDTPSGVNSTNRVEYVWTKQAEQDWTGPTIWAMYSQDASDVLWRWCVTTAVDEDGNPVPPAKPGAGNVVWANNLSTLNLSKDTPYMWMSSQIVPAGQPMNNNGWTEPVLFGHWGQDGADGENGQDGVTPPYTTTIYGFVPNSEKPLEDIPTLPTPNDGETIDEYVDRLQYWNTLPVVKNNDLVIEDGALDRFLAAIAEGGDVTLESDLITDAPIVIEKDVNLNLNGKRIVVNAWIEDDGSSNSYAFWVRNGKLTIDGNGCIYARPSDYSMAVWVNGGDVVINGGTYKNGGESCTLIYLSGKGTAEINDGLFIATLIGPQAGTGDKRTALNIKNSNVNTCSFSVKGGKFLDFDPSDNLAEGPGTNFLAEGYSSVKDGDYYVVVSNEPAPVSDEPTEPVVPETPVDYIDNEDQLIWWHCIVCVNSDDTIEQFGPIRRYTTVDGNAIPGEYTQFLFKWSPTQTLEWNKNDFNGNNPVGWYDKPDYDTEIQKNLDASLWMIVGRKFVHKVDGNVVYDNGVPVYNSSWTTPVKISGPRGPISYDYRIETRYNIGTADRPKALPTEEEWKSTPPAITNKYPYIWAVNYLLCYKMKYDYANPNGDGTYPIIEDGDGIIVDTRSSYFRLTGLDGEDGNRKNSLKYSNTSESVRVTSFSAENLYIANGEDGTEVVYTIALDQLTFIDGYTGKFANVGNGKVIIKSPSSMPLTASGKTAQEIELLPQESVELVCYNNGDIKQLIVMGKPLV